MGGLIDDKIAIESKGKTYEFNRNEVAMVRLSVEF